MMQLWGRCERPSVRQASLLRLLLPQTKGCTGRIDDDRERPLAHHVHHILHNRRAERFRETLGLMKSTAWLINAARGPLVDEAALIEALSSGGLEAAGLDVQLHEPPDPANPLLKLPNVVLSPHNAAAPLECNEKMSVRAAKNMLELFDGTLDPGYVVNPEALPNRRNL